MYQWHQSPPESITITELVCNITRIFVYGIDIQTMEDRGGSFLEIIITIVQNLRVCSVFDINRE